MKQIIKFCLGIILIATLFSSTVSAQKYAYVDTKYILENIPEYKAAMQQLDNVSITWQKEIEDRYAIIDKLYKAYQAEQVLLTEEMKKRRQDEINTKEKDVKELQKQRFGYEGDLFKKKQELIKPVQDKIYNAVKKFATDGSYAVIFDKASDLIMLYSNPKYDKSDDILNALGYKVTKNRQRKLLELRNRRELKNLPEPQLPEPLKKESKPIIKIHPQTI